MGGHARRSGDTWARISVPPVAARRGDGLRGRALDGRPRRRRAHWIGRPRRGAVQCRAGGRRAGGRSLVLLAAPVELKREVARGARRPDRRVDGAAPRRLRSEADALAGEVRDLSWTSRPHPFNRPRTRPRTTTYPPAVHCGSASTEPDVPRHGLETESPRGRFYLRPRSAAAAASPRKLRAAHSPVPGPRTCGSCGRGRALRPDASTRPGVGPSGWRRPTCAACWCGRRCAPAGATRARSRPRRRHAVGERLRLDGLVRQSRTPRATAAYRRRPAAWRPRSASGGTASRSYRLRDADLLPLPTRLRPAAPAPPAASLVRAPASAARRAVPPHGDLDGARSGGPQPARVRAEAFDYLSSLAGCGAHLKDSSSPRPPRPRP